VPLNVEPELASWDSAGQPSQTRLAHFLDHVQSVASPLVAGVEGVLAVELVVGLPQTVSLTAGGRDLDNYLFPVAQRLGAQRLAAVFGRKVHGRSGLAVGHAEPAAFTDPPMFATRVAGSYVRREWKEAVRDRLVRVSPAPLPAGPIALDVAITTGPGRNWSNLWKPLVDAFGPLLGEQPGRLFNPYDDRIVTLGLHHRVEPRLGHDVGIETWWKAAPQGDVNAP
jgi:hypothetical protein